MEGNVKRIKLIFSALLVLAIVFAAFNLPAFVTDVAAAPAGAIQVGTHAELAGAFGDSSASAIALTKDITVTANLAPNHDIAIYGQGKTISLGAYAIDAGANALTLADTLTITADASENSSGITGTGRFAVEAGANIRITRPLGKYTPDLISGFSDYQFGQDCTFYASAGTNRSDSVLYWSQCNKGLLQTAVIKSLLANSFVVEAGADVTLVSDYSGAKNTDHGSAALILRKPKGGELLIDVQSGGALNVTAYGTGLKTRSHAPVLVLHEAVSGNTGVSRTTVQGTLNVTSNNGNGWYYQYIDYVTNTSDYFTVDGGVVNILAKNGESKSKTEYAAFESYGKNPMYITVENGGIMNVISNGYRGMSLAGGGSYATKDITVRGAGSKLNVYGYMWAIAAETQPTLSISAVDGGEIVLESCVDNLGNILFAGSTVYSVGPTNYKVDGAGSKMKIMHYGGEYGAIFADGWGVLDISVTNGGDMYVYSKNSGYDTAARRAAICAQTGLSNVHSILVDGADSTLEVINDNTGNCNDYSLYPRSAVAFAANTSGNITVSNGGNFYAQNNNAQSPTIALGGYGTNNTNGKLTLDNPGEVDIKNNADTTNARAIALRSTNFHSASAGNAKVSFDVRSADVTVWPIGKGATNWLETDMFDKWESVTFTAQNNVALTMPATGVKGNTAFKLSDYGRIGTRGDYTAHTVTFEANGGTPVPPPQSVPAGGKAVIPEAPVKEEEKLVGWYAASDLSGDPWNFAVDTVTADMILYAKWESDPLDPPPTKELGWVVEYYRDSISADNLVGRAGMPPVTYGTVVELTQDQLDVCKLEGYQSGVQEGGSVAITTEGQTIYVLYQKT